MDRTSVFHSQSLLAAQMGSAIPLGKQLIFDGIEYDDNGTSELSHSGNANVRHDGQDCYSWLFGNENWWIYISDAKSVRCEFVL